MAAFMMKRIFAIFLVDYKRLPKNYILTAIDFNYRKTVIIFPKGTINLTFLLKIKI